MGIFRGDFKSKTARFPEKLFIDLPQRLPNKRNVLGAQLGNTATQLSNTGGVKGYGVDLAEWITHQINEGLISITGGDTHSFNTNLTSTANRTHTLGVNTTWTMQNPGGFFGFYVNTFGSGSMKLGEVNSHTNDIRITSSGINIVGNNGHTISLGDPFESENGTVLSIDDYTQEITLQNTGVTSIGDSAGNGNSTLITVNDGLEIINLSNSVSSINMDNDEGVFHIISAIPIVIGDPLLDDTSARLIMDVSNNYFQVQSYETYIGDFDGLQNSTVFTIDDTNQIVNISNAGVTGIGDMGNTENRIIVDAPNGKIELGSDRVGIVEDNRIISPRLVVGELKEIDIDTGTFTNGAMTIRKEVAIQALSTGGTTSTFDLNIPAGALLLGMSIKVSVAITTSGGDNTWEAALSVGSTSTIAATSTSGAQNTHVKTMLVPEVLTDATDLVFTAGNGENFAGGEVVITYVYAEWADMPDFGV